MMAVASIFPSGGNKASELVPFRPPATEPGDGLGGLERPVFAACRPYFGFADHMK
jgi:hypothetical protein